MVNTPSCFDFTSFFLSVVNTTIISGRADVYHRTGKAAWLVLINETEKRMTTPAKTKIRDRKQAGRLLAQQLKEYRNEDAVVLAIPKGGILVGSGIAESLGLPLEVIACRRIKHPADRRKSIGSIGLSTTLLHDHLMGIPQDYVYHQQILVRSEIEREMKIFYPDHPGRSVTGKTVILADDLVPSFDNLCACLEEIRKQNPARIVVTAGVITASARIKIQKEVDALIVLNTVKGALRAEDYFSDFSPVSEDCARNEFHLFNVDKRLAEESSLQFTEAVIR